MTVPAVKTPAFSPAQLRIIRQSVAKDANEEEFNLFMESARAWGLDPFRKQIWCIIYNKDKPDKRTHAIFPSRDGLRVMASRCRDYRPASEPPQIEQSDDMKDATNPQGLISATVRLWKQDSRGEWFPVVGTAHWGEFAPIKEVWAYDEQERKKKPSGEFEVQFGNWTKMPRLMLTKCAEGQALRAGWPETFGGLYLEEEMDRLAVDISASQEIEEYERQQRQALTGGPGLLMVFDDAMKLEKVKIGEVHDRVDEFLKSASSEDAMAFRVRNEEALRDFWAHDKPAALDLKRKFEAKEAEFKRSATDAA